MTTPSDDRLSPFRLSKSVSHTSATLSEQARKEKRARVEEWKIRKRAQRDARKSQQRKAATRATATHLPYMHTDKVARLDMVTLNKRLLASFISAPEWGEISDRIKYYQQQLSEITAELKTKKKRCTGCALNPYKAKFASALQMDLNDIQIVPPPEIDLIKSALNTRSLQVGTINGRAHIR